MHAKRSASVPAVWADGPRRQGTELTSAQWDAAEAQGRSLFKDHYEASPVWPNGPPPKIPLQLPGR